MGRGDLSDAEWALNGPLLPPAGRHARPASGNRRFISGMLHVLRVGCPWHKMRERYGKWNSVYVRSRRWAEQGVGDALLQTLANLGLTDDWRHMIDSTSVRGHVSAAGGKEGLCECFWSITRRTARRPNIPTIAVIGTATMSSACSTRPSSNVVSLPATTRPCSPAKASSISPPRACG